MSQGFPCRTWKHPVKNGLRPTERNASEIIWSQSPCPKCTRRGGSLIPFTWGKNPAKKTVAGTSQSSTGYCCLLWQRRVAMHKISIDEAKSLETAYRKVKTAQVVWNWQDVLSTVWSIESYYGQGTNIIKSSEITAYNRCSQTKRTQDTPRCEAMLWGVRA